MRKQNFLKTLKKILLTSFALYAMPCFSQNNDKLVLNIEFTLLDIPENIKSPHPYPSMLQASEWSANLYDLSFWGINEASVRIIKNKKNTWGGKVAQKGLEYTLGLVYSKYASELPIPLGVWAHEAFHCSVLGTVNKSAVNGNSIFNRWDGTVYGLTDEDLTVLKNENLSQLLYSYTAGIHSEVYTTQQSVMTDFYHKRKFYKNALYLYNAWYVYDYFRFSTSPASDSVKILAPPHEDTNPFYRDYAGADLTAWVYDMFSPDAPYENRDTFPNGDGVNRRIGFSELSSDGQNFLKKQKSLSLLNFANPAIFLVNQINVSSDFSFLPFMQYAPTHFGNAMALYVPFTFRTNKQLLAVHSYQNSQQSYIGLQYAVYEMKPFLNKKIAIGGTLSVWKQPEHQSYFDTNGKLGGNIEITGGYELGKGFSTQLAIGYKTDGWMIGNAYLTEQANLKFGLSYKWIK
ncbi:MAG: hypothetical protein WCX31_13985 [Salinivirgaceae bacterium]